jgi:hypothetical protein
MTKDISDRFSSLYSFIAKLIILLEEELELLALHKNESNIIATKNITETLNKLVDLIIRLNKLSNEQSLLKPEEIDEKDKIIISSFLDNFLSKI